MLFFDQYYTYFMVGATFVLSLFKIWALPYPSGYWSIEFIVLVFYWALATTRISYGLTGNRIESMKHIFGMLSIGIFQVICNFYFVFQQTYILKVEVMLQLCAVVFTAAETLLGLFALILFRND